ncbi:MAG: sigma-54-dependent Fis family transcriptional regulator [Elusimicrobia bacterium]|nr:sigma-54-dependent Fis family transcriptional regulator [Elusimicrobiota bacterium]
MTTILVVDDDAQLVETLQRYLEAKGSRTLGASSGRQAARILEQQAVDLMLLDLTLDDGPGLGLLKKIRETEEAIPVIILTGNADIQSAVTAMKMGAANYITKPIANEALWMAIEKALKEKNMLLELTALKEQLKSTAERELFLGEAPAIRRVLDQAKKVAPTDLTVLVEGDSGSGKEMLARLIHRWSRRNEGPFVALDCGAIPEGLIESELFGHEQGAFTGADSKKLGLFETAFQGTLFLDEVGNLSPGAQAKLLRAIETKMIRRLGGKKDIPVDARMIAAANQNLAAAAGNGLFREDLLYRLNQFAVKLPPLKARRQDIPLLTGHFINEANRSLGKSVRRCSAEASAWLIKQPWPGNIRELKNAITRACLLADTIIELKHFEGLQQTDDVKPANNAQKNERAARKTTALKSSLNARETDIIMSALKKTKNNKRQAARLLGISRSVLYYKLDRLNLGKHMSKD